MTCMGGWDIISYSDGWMVVFPHAAEIFDAVECGVDVFDGCYPYTATEKGCALTFPNQLAARDSEELPSSNGEAAHAKQAELLPLEIDLKKEELVSWFFLCSIYRHYTKILSVHVQELSILTD